MTAADAIAPDTSDLPMRHSQSVVWSKTQDAAFERREQLGGTLPIFTREGRPCWMPDKRGDSVLKKGWREFTVCDYYSMYDYIRNTPHLDRTFYETIIHDQPCHLAIDFDCATDEMHSSKGHLNRTQVITELQACIGAACRQLRAKEVALFDFDPEQVVYEELVANRPSKMSYHWVCKFPEHRMFTNQSHVHSFMLLAMKITHERHPDVASNPMFFLNTEGNYVSAIDVKIWTRNRNFRMIGCCKNKMTDEEKDGFLWPLCRHAETITCEEANCRFQVRHVFSYEEFLRYLICYVPSGVQPRLFEVPFIDPQSLRPEGPRGSVFFRDCTNTAVDNAQLMRESSRRMNANVSLHKDAEINPVAVQSCVLLQDSVASMDAPDTPSPDTLYRRLMRKIANAISVKIGAYCRFVSCRTFGDCYFESGSGECPYRNLLHPDRGYAHKSEHVAFTCRLGYPTMVIEYLCHDEECKKSLKRWGDEPPRLQRQKLDIDVLPLMEDFLNFTLALKAPDKTLNFNTAAYKNPIYERVRKRNSYADLIATTRKMGEQRVQSRSSRSSSSIMMHGEKNANRDMVVGIANKKIKK